MLQCLLEKVIVIWHIGESPVKYSGNLEFQLTSTNQQLGDINIYMWLKKEEARTRQKKKKEKKALLVDSIFNLWESRYMKQENSQESSKNELYRRGLESLCFVFSHVWLLVVARMFLDVSVDRHAFRTITPSPFLSTTLDIWGFPFSVPLTPGYMDRARGTSAEIISKSKTFFLKSQR